MSDGLVVPCDVASEACVVASNIDDAFVVAADGLPIVAYEALTLVAHMPVATTVAPPRLSLEIVAVAAGVFALVQCLLVVALPAEVIWIAVIGLAAIRRVLPSSGGDVVLAAQWSRPRRSRIEGRNNF